MQDTIREVILVVVPLVLAFLVWVTKSIYDLKKHLVTNEDIEEKLEKLQLEVDSNTRWATKTEAVLKPDQELRKEIPIVLDLIKQHGQALQTMRDTLIMLQKEVNVKLAAVEEKVTAIEKNCFLHQMVSKGKNKELLDLLESDNEQE